MRLLSNIPKNISVSKLALVVSITILLSIVTACEPRKENLANNSEPSVNKLPQSSLQQTISSRTMSSKLSEKMVVSSVLPAGRYSYIEGANNGVRSWIATNQLQVNQGDTILYQNGQTMFNFHSKTLDKTFDKIIFTDSVMVVNRKVAMKQAPSEKQTSNVAPQSSSQLATGLQPENPHKTGKLPIQSAVTNISVQKIEDGYTVEELYANKKTLNKQTVKVRGKVVKYTKGILGKNWIHLQDGSGSQGTHDLTITTQGSTKVGDTIVSTGKLMMDKDIGQGYFYSLIMEDASITIE